MKAKRLAAAFLVLALSISQFSVALADKKTDAQNKKNEAKENLNKQKDEIAELEGKQAALQEEIDALDAELVQVMIDLSTLEEKLSIAVDRLAQTQAELEQAKIDETNQYEAMKKRIQFMYERGETTVITDILAADNISDMLNRAEYFNEMYDYDRKLLVTYQKTKEKVAALEAEQEQEVADMEATRTEYQAAATNYRDTIAAKESTMEGFAGKLEQARALASKYQDTISAQNTIIAAEEAREAREAEERRQAEANNHNNTGGNNNTGSENNSTGGGNSNTGGGNKNPGYATNVSGSDVVAYAVTFKGNPYVWGGKDPNTGADCSGFTSYVYGHFGINIPSYSYSQRFVGKEVSYSNAQPGDLICYEGHVAIYMGNGKIVHAKGTAYGIVAGDTATYRKIVTVRRVL